MAAPAGLITSLNRIRELSSDIYHQYIPELTEDSDISAFGKPVLQYQVVQNEFMSSLINRIAYTSFEIKYFNSPLKVLEGDKIPLGHAGQDLYVNPAKGRKFNVDDFAGLLVKYEADVKAQYFEVNSDLQYPVTVSKAKLQKAFTSWENLGTFVDEITNSLYQAAYIDEFNQSRALVTNAFKSNRVNYETISAVSTADTAKAFIEKARELFLNYQSPSTQYNAWHKIGGEGRPVVTWTAPEDIVFIIRNDVRAKIDVEVLASAFNIDKTTLLGNIISVPDFNILNDDGTTHTSATEIVGIMCDKAWFKIKEQDRDMSEFYNANNRSWTFYLNLVKMYNYSLFANATVFCTSAPTVKATKIEFGTDTVEIDQGDHEGLDVTITPAEATSEITYSVTAYPEGGAATDLVLTASDNGRHLDIKAKSDADAGNYTVTASAESGSVTDTVTVTVAEVSA